MPWKIVCDPWVSCTFTYTCSIYHLHRIIRNYNPYKHTYTHTHTHTRAHTDSYSISTDLDCIFWFLIHFVICLKIVVL